MHHSQLVPDAVLPAEASDRHWGRLRARSLGKGSGLSPLMPLVAAITRVSYRTLIDVLHCCRFRMFSVMGSTLSQVAGSIRVLSVRQARCRAARPIIRGEWESVKFTTRGRFRHNSSYSNILECSFELVNFIVCQISTR